MLPAGTQEIVGSKINWEQRRKCSINTEIGYATWITFSEAPGASTAGRFPVREISLSDIQEHPNNVAYSIVAKGIANLAESIEHDRLTDLPLVRRLQGGRGSK